jgi:hypothetical protein
MVCMGSSVSGSELAAYRVVNRIDRAIDPGHHFLACAERSIRLTILRARVFDLFYGSLFVKSTSHEASD